MKKQWMQCCLAILLALTGGGNAWADNQIVYALGDSALHYGTGGKNTETYDVALRIQEPELVGATIKGVRIAFSTTKKLSNARAWLTRELPEIKNFKAGEPDITSKAFDLKQEYVEITFDEPYTITDDGVYVGYSFDVARVDTAIMPVVTTRHTSPDGFYIHTTKVYRSAWRSLYGYAGQLAIQVLLEGDVIKTNSACISYVEEVNVKTGDDFNLMFDVTNHGAAGSSTIDYTIKVNGQEFNKTAQTNLRPIFGDNTTISTQIPALTEKGRHPVSITINKVNGVENEATNPMGENRVNAYNIMPKHRAVLEEYTGLWCGYCPRGFVGLEEMNRLYPEDFIGISYHYDDAMEITRKYPSSVAGFPDAWLDRIYETDAFCGDAQYGLFGIDKAWEKRCKEFTPAFVEVSTEWTNENTLHATAYITFPLEDSECPYVVGFALVADGLSDPEWSQSNYYNGEVGWPASMDLFTKNSKSYVTGLTFNDVIIDSSADRGIEGSLSAPIEGDVPQTVDYDFDISAIKTSLVPADRTKLRVVAMLINTQNGVIVNANKAQAGSVSTGIKTVGSTSEVVKSVRYYDLQGRPALNPTQGIFIKAETMQDGKVQTGKVRF